MEVKLIAMSRRMDGGKAVDICAEAAGMCVGKGASMSGLRTAIESGHESLIEHISFTFRVDYISRVTLAQLTRHRMASYSVLSQRYVCHKKGNRVAIYRKWSDDTKHIYAKAIRHAFDAYEELILRGVPQEDARYVLPEATATSLIMTMNARELRHFFSLRCCERAQGEIRELANRMLKICREQVPELFSDAGAPCVRGECREKKPCGKGGTKDDNHQ